MPPKTSPEKKPLPDKWTPEGDRPEKKPLPGKWTPGGDPSRKIPLNKLGEAKYTVKKKKRTKKQKAKRAAKSGIRTGLSSGVLTTLFNAGNPKALRHGMGFGAAIAPVAAGLSYMNQPDYSVHLKRASLNKTAQDGKMHSGMTPEEIEANSTPNTYSPKQEKKKGFKGFMQRLIPGGKDGMEMNLRDSKGRTPEEFKALPFDERKQHSNELNEQNKKA